MKKHAILVMYKVFLNFPDALRPAFPRLKDRLEDADSGKSVGLCLSVQLDYCIGEMHLLVYWTIVLERCIFQYIRLLY